MFRSVKNWLTLLILALVALAMLVAWVYVVPPLQGRLDQQKLVEPASATPSCVSDTRRASALGYDERDRRRPSSPTAAFLETRVSRLGLALQRRVVVYTREPGACYDTGRLRRRSGRRRLPHARSAAIMTGQVDAGDGHHSPRARYAATAVPLFADGEPRHRSPPSCWSSRRSRTWTTPWPRCSASCCSPPCWRWASASSSGTWPRTSSPAA